MQPDTSAQEIRRLMEAHDLTTADVAGHLRVAVRTVQAWLAGQNPTPYMAAELLRRIVAERAA